MKSRSLLTSFATLISLTAAPAMAADMRMPAKAPPLAPVPVAYNWTGCYVGAGGGYGMWNQDATLLVDGVVDVPQRTFGGRGWFGTVQVGCDYQVAPSIVIGAFADYDFSGIKGDFAIGSGLFGREKLKSSWAAGGRIGWLPIPQLLTFVSGGYTQAHFGAVSFHQEGGTPSNYSLAKHNYSGWFIGTGYEYQLGWVPGLTWKTEYRFADYGKESVALLLSDVPSAYTVDSHKYVHTVRSELVWRFNFGGYGAPVVARY